MSKYCSNCGKQAGEGSFCSFCGSVLSAPKAADTDELSPESQDKITKFTDWLIKYKPERSANGVFLYLREIPEHVSEVERTKPEFVWTLDDGPGEGTLLTPGFYPTTYGWIICQVSQDGSEENLELTLKEICPDCDGEGSLGDGTLCETCDSAGEIWTALEGLDLN